MTTTLRFSFAYVAALAGGCAQWNRHVSEPAPLERNFSHPLLAGRADYYPSLATPRDDAPRVGSVGDGSQRRPLAPSAESTPRKATGRALTAAALPRAVKAAPPAAEGAPEVATLELESTANGLSFAGQAEPPTTDTPPIEGSAEGGVDIAAVPERPRAPKATVDLGLGDPSAGTEPGVLEAAAAESKPEPKRALTIPGEINPRRAEGPDADAAREAVAFDPASPVLDAPAQETKPEAAEATPETTGSHLGDGTATLEALAAAQRLLGVRTPWDEGRFLAHLMAAADLDIRAADSQGVIRAVHDHLEGKGLVSGPSTPPERGDLVFFSNTFDRDDDGRADDWFTMVGIVESVDETMVTFIGVTQGEVRRMVFDLQRPSAERSADGAVLNSHLRAKALSDRPFTKYLAGELVAAFGRLPSDAF